MNESNEWSADRSNMGDRSKVQRLAKPMWRPVMVLVVMLLQTLVKTSAWPLAQQQQENASQIKVGEKLVNGTQHAEEDQDAHERAKRSYNINDNIIMYLTNFGYLPQSDLETGNLRTDDQIVQAIKNLQSYGGVEVTGKFDEATKDLMKKPRCGLPDILSESFRSKRHATIPLSARHSARRRLKRYIIQGQKWHHTNLTWSLRQPTASMDVGRTREDIRRALDLWSQVSRLTFKEINSDDADIRVSFQRLYHGDGYPFDGRGTLLAHAFFPGPNIGGDAHFDDDERWVSDQSGTEGMNFFAVAVHEFGHSLGLSHTPVQDAIMYPYYQSSDKYALGQDDIRGIQYLYQAKEGLPLPTNPNVNPTPVPPKPTTTKKPLHPTKSTTTQPPVSYGPNTRPPVTRPPEERPDTCDTSYDAISMIRNEVFIFKGKWFWRIGRNGLVPGYPHEIRRFWQDLPTNLTHIDAVYEKSDQTESVIFIGKQYWVFDGNRKKEGPLPLTKLGLPDTLDKIDGAVIWGWNGKTYLFSGSMYWRYDEAVNHVELDYPRDMSMWQGVPYNIDSVFKYKDGNTYFFKGKGFWKFNDMQMRVSSPVQTLSAPVWMGCPTRLEGALFEPGLPQPSESSSSACSIDISPLIYILISASLLWRRNVA